MVNIRRNLPSVSNTWMRRFVRSRRIGWTAGAVGAREHEHMALGIDGDARDLSEIGPRRQLEEVGNGIEGNFRHALLSEGRRGEQHEQGEQTGFHRGLQAGLTGSEMEGTILSDEASWLNIA